MEKIKFGRRKGFILKTDPQVVGEYCHDLEQKKGGKITPKELVEAAKDVNSPLHCEFEWNDSVAAQKFRETQASYIIRSIEVEIVHIPTSITNVEVKIVPAGMHGVRFYHALSNNGTGYENLYSINNDEWKRKKLLDNCLRDIRNLKNKYETLRDELPGFFKAIDDVLK